MHRRGLKFTLAFIAAALVLMLFLLSDQRRVVSIQSRIAPEDVSQYKDESPVDPSLQDLGETVMESPRFSGEDNKNRRWELTAEQARQSGSVENEEIFLDDVDAVATIGSGKELKFKAGQGYFKREGDVLKLEENVVIKGYGLTMTTEEVTSDLNNRNIQGNKPIHLESKAGELNAKSFIIKDNGSVVRLEGGVTGKFYPAQKPASKTETITGDVN